MATANSTQPQAEGQQELPPHQVQQQAQSSGQKSAQLSKVNHEAHLLQKSWEGVPQTLSSGYGGGIGLPNNKSSTIQQSSMVSKKQKQPTQGCAANS